MGSLDLSNALTALNNGILPQSLSGRIVRLVGHIVPSRFIEGNQTIMDGLFWRSNWRTQALQLLRYFAVVSGSKLLILFIEGNGSRTAQPRSSAKSKSSAEAACITVVGNPSSHTLGCGWNIIVLNPIPS